MDEEPIFKLKIAPKVYLLNAPIITSFGTFKHTLINSEQAREIATFLADNGKRYLKGNVISAIGHEATARYLACLLDVDEVPVNRIGVEMYTGDKAIVLRCLARLPEGKVLTFEEMNNYAWQLTLLEKIE
jgi:hypothetical protein